jgi:hypothetical protein
MALTPIGGGVTGRATGRKVLYWWDPMLGPPSISDHPGKAGHDLAARVLIDLAQVRDADRQLALVDGTVLPRARQAAAVARSAYEAGQSSLVELIDAQRSVIAIARGVAVLRASRENDVADLEAAIARPVGG